jgi:hypothetical protein
LILNYNFKNIIINIGIEKLLEIFIINISTKFDIIIILYILNIIIIISMPVSVIGMLGRMVVSSAEGGIVPIIISSIKNVV